MMSLPNTQVLNLALTYHEAAQVLDDARANPIPVINLRCHAIELFLKSLHLRDVASDIGEGVFLLTPSSGKAVNHDLNHSFDKALERHRAELLSDRLTLRDDLAILGGVFQRSRYLYENGGSLPISTAKQVSQYLADRLAVLPRLAVSV